MAGTTLRRKANFLVAALAGPMLLGACVSTYGANDISAGAVRSAATVRSGTVISIREVTIRPDNTVVATGTGAVLGGLLGSQVGGRGSTQAIGTVGGAVLGGLLGNAVGNAAGTRRGYAYVVEFANGERREIVQGRDVFISPGTAVNITFRRDGAIVTPAV